MASATRVQRSIEFQFGVDLGPAENSVAGLERQLEQLQEQFKSAEIGSAEFNRLGQEIQATSSKLKTLDERFEGLGIEQKNAMIVDSFNVVVGAVGAVTGALVAFGVESKVLEGVEKRLLGIITVVSSLREVSNGLAAAQKTLVPLINQATQSLKAFALANPYTAIAAGLTLATAAIYKYITAQLDENDAIEKYNKSLAEGNELLKKRQEIRDIAFEQSVEAARLIGGERAALEQELVNLEELISDARANVRKAARVQAEELAKLEKAATIFFATPGSPALEKAYKDQLLRVQTFAEEVNKVDLNLEKLLTQQGVAKKKILDLQNNEIEKANTKAKELQAKIDKANEDLAIKAVKQLNDQRQATEDLIDLYTSLYPEKVSGGQFEFNTELDRTNFLLQQQLDVLFSLNTEYEDLGDQLVEITDDLDETFFSEKQLAVFKKLRDSNKTQLQLQLDALDATYREDLALFSDNEEMKSKITAQYEEDRAKLRRQFAIQTAQDIIGVTSNFVNILAEINQQSLELQLAQAAGNQAAIDKINADALEKQKKLRIAQTLITTAESILNGFNATSTLPPPFNFIAGGILALAYGALGTKTIATINATTLEGGGSSSSGFNNIPSGGFSLPTGGGVQIPTSQGATLPGLGGGRVGRAPSIGTVAQEPIRAYVLAGDVENGVQANIALNNRRRLAG